MRSSFIIALLLTSCLLQQQARSQGFDEPWDESPVGGNVDDPLEVILLEPSKEYAGGGYAAHPILLKYFTEQTYTYTGGRYHEAPIRYRLLMPEQTKPDKKYPLVVWLHGAGESDDDNIRQLSHLQHIVNFIAGDRKRDFYMLATQCPADQKSWQGSISSEGQGDAPLTVATEIMHHLLEKYPIDRDCVTVAGLSAGGSATWEFAARCNDVVAAMAAFSSNPPDVATQNKLKGISIWLFNSTNDKGTPIDELRKVTARLQNDGYRIHLTEFPTASHDSWAPALRGSDDAFDWLLSQRKNNRWSPLPGRPFALRNWVPLTIPFLIPVFVVLVIVLILRDRRLRSKRLAALRKQTDISADNERNEVNHEP